MKFALSLCSAPCSTAFRKLCWSTGWRSSSRIPRSPANLCFRARWDCGAEGPLDLSFLDPTRPALRARLPVFRIGARRRGESESVRRTHRRTRPELFHRLPLPRSHGGGAGAGQDGRRRLSFERRPRTAFDHRRLRGHRHRKCAALPIARTKGHADRAPEGLQRKHRRVAEHRRAHRGSGRPHRIVESAARRTCSKFRASEALRRKLDEVLPRDLAGEIAARAAERTCFRHL